MKEQANVGQVCNLSPADGLQGTSDGLQSRATVEPVCNLVEQVCNLSPDALPDTKDGLQSRPTVEQVCNLSPDALPHTSDGLQSRPTVGQVHNLVGQVCNLSPGSAPVCFFKPFDPQSEVSRRRRQLPHWQQPGATYFITFRLGDALPQAKLEQWKQERDLWLKARGLTDAGQVPTLSETDRRTFHRYFTARLERWLDDGLGSCVLRDPQAAQIMADTLRFFDGVRCVVDEFVVMPNHVHLLGCPLDGWRLEALLHSWKRHSARLINQLLGRTGNLWLDEYFDHGVRSRLQLEKYRRYIRDNPAQAKLREGEFLLGCGTGVHYAGGTGSPACETGLQPCGTGLQPVSR